MSCDAGTVSIRRIASPLDVYWSVTQGCNFECNFCFTSSGPGTTRDDLSADDREKILQMILASGALRVVLTGGEPLIVPELLDYVDRIRAKGMGVKITTNGALLRPATVERLARAGVRIQISIEHHDPRLNDLLMGASESRDRVLEGLARARAAGIPCEVKITLQAANSQGLAPLYERLHELGVERIDVSEAVPLGRAVENWSELEVSREDMLRASAQAAEARARGIPVDFSSTRLQNEEAGTPAGCSLGMERPRTILIDERGDVRPCAASQTFGWKNSILEHGLIGAWDRLVELGKYRNDYQELEGECRTCELVETCKGGCRGVAYGVWGHFKGPDPYCPKVGKRENRRFFGRQVSPVVLVFPDGTSEGEVA